MLPRLELRVQGPDVTAFNMASDIQNPGMISLPREKSNFRKSSARGKSELFKSHFDLMDIERERTQTPKTARQTAERHAELEVEHNWLLKEEEQRQKKKFVQTKDKLTICLPEDDPLDSIQQRLEEIQSMVKPRAKIPDFLTALTTEQRNKIMSVSAEDVESIKKTRRKNWKVLDIFRHAIKLIILINKTCIPKFRYYQQDDITPINKNKDNGKKSHQRSSLGIEVQLSISSSPEHRTSRDIKRITWVLRATKVFRHLFPAEIEKELAQIVAYERYEDGRHITYQDKEPNMFYYVLNGRIQKLREYQLTSGCVNKCMGYLNKGMTSNTDDLIRNRAREYHLVAKGPVEVLILHREDFMRLQNTTHGPPVDFLKTVDLFSEFPCDEFLSNPDAIEYRYYGQNKIIAKNALDTPWIHVIKSGEVKVVRIQYVIDVSNDSIFEGQTTEELGCGRSFSHASAMLGVLAKQRQLKLKTLKENEQECDMSESQETQNMKMVHKNVFPPCKEILPEIPQICVQEEITLPNIRRHNKEVQKMDDSTDISGRISRSKSVSLPPIVQASIVAPRVGEGFHPHGTFLTREKTDTDVVYGKGNRKKEQTHRRAYLQLDTLSTGDIFGLETLETSNDILYDGPAVSLMSDGAEVVKISKRFFLQHAQNNTILKVETLQRQFLTTEEVKSILYDQETWTQYKQILMQRLTTALSPRKSQVSLGS